MTEKEWIDEYRKQARASGDARRLRLTEIDWEAWPYRDTNPDQMAQLYQEGRTLAEQLDEPWWALFFDSRRADTLLYSKGDYRAAQELAVRNMLRARAPIFTGFPLAFEIQQTLVHTYIGIEPLGYAGEIEGCFRYMESNGPLTERQRYLLQARRIAFAIGCRRYDEARDIALDTLAHLDADRDSSNTAYFAPHVYSSLCYIDAQREDWESLGAWARLSEQQFHDAEHRIGAAVVMWQAVLARRAGVEPDAQRLRARAAALMARNAVTMGHYWAALAAFHETGGELLVALDNWTCMARGAGSVGTLADECDCLIERCRLLVRLGSLTAEDVDAVHKTAGKLRTPATYLARLDAVLNVTTLRGPRDDASGQHL